MINSVSKNQFNKIILRIFLYLILTVFVVYYLLPLFVMITTSLKSLEEIRTGSLIALPRNITFEHLFHCIILAQYLDHYNK